MIRPLDRIFRFVRSSPFLYRVVWLTRILLAAGFIPTGAVKLLGERFTQVDPGHPIGAFFEAMYQTGLYWRFLGLSQAVAGVLLLVPRWAHLGAAMFLPIMLNIFVITVALAFRGTPAITGLMLAAVLLLCAWDWPRFRPLFTAAPPLPDLPLQRLDRLEAAGFTAVAASLLTFFATTRGLVPSALAPAAMLLGAVAGLATLGRFLWCAARWRRSF